MAEYVDIETARGLSGLRLVLTRMPGAPWTEAAKAVFDVKGIPYARVAQVTGQTDAALREWTGIVNAPIAIYEDERPRAGWLEILLLAERLAPEPRLIPAEPRERALMLGLAGELLSEDGLVWNRRLNMFEQGFRQGSPLSGFARLRGRDYGWSPEAAERATGRIIEVLRLMSEQLAAAQRAGHAYLTGDALSALDLYWATACAIVAPLPRDQAAMPDAVREAYEAYPEPIAEALDPALVEHRDFVYREHLTLPIDT